MDNRFSRLSVIALLTTASLTMTGCASYMKTVARVQNHGFELHPDSVNAHLYAEVSRDEIYIGDIILPRRTHYMPESVQPDNGTYNFRIVESHMTLIDPPLPSWFPVFAHGARWAFRSAVVPDQFPRLMEGDIIELRNIGTWETMDELPTKGEGSAVTRVICRVQTPEFEKCKSMLPKIGRFPRPAGLTGTEFKPSLKDYAPLTFSRWYDDNGKALRPFPTEIPAAYTMQFGAEANKRTDGKLAPVEDRSVTYR